MDYFYLYNVYALQISHPDDLPIILFYHSL